MVCEKQISIFGYFAPHLCMALGCIKSTQITCITCVNYRIKKPFATFLLQRVFEFILKSAGSRLREVSFVIPSPLGEG